MCFWGHFPKYNPYQGLIRDIQYSTSGLAVPRNMYVCVCVSPVSELIRRLQLLSVCSSNQVDHRQLDHGVLLTGLKYPNKQ